MNGAVWTWSELLQGVRKVLESSASTSTRESASAEAERLVQGAAERVLGQVLPRHVLHLGSGELVDVQVTGRALRWARERAEGTPLQYLLGYQEFLDHRYTVRPGVLIPRPETEVLVRAVQEELRRGGGTGSLATVRHGLEIGVGSGAISIELLATVPGLSMLATELSPVARECAAENARAILGEEGAARLEVLSVQEGREVFEPLEGRAGREPVDLLVSNPPYLVQGASTEVTSEVARHEPAEALYAPEGDPLFFYRKIAEGAPQHVKRGGFVALEVPHERAAEIRELFELHRGVVELLNDLSSRPRVLLSRY